MFFPERQVIQSYRQQPLDGPIRRWLDFIERVFNALYEAAEELTFGTIGPSTGAAHLRLE